MVLVLPGHRGILFRWLPLIVYREIKSFQSKVGVFDELPNGFYGVEMK